MLEEEGVLVIEVAQLVDVLVVEIAHRVVWPDVIIALHPIASLEFKHVDNALGALHETLAGDEPRCAHAPEIPPAMLLGETG